jgi:iron complex outermembrane receptor protein
MKTFLFIVCILCFTESHTQNTFQAIIKDSHTKEPLIGSAAILEGTNNGAIADLSGLVTITNIPDGKQLIIFSYVGYETRKDSFYFPLPLKQPITVFLEKGEELEEVIVFATRRSRTIEEIPTRMEAITAEELGEKAVMNSTNIAMLLRESTGIQMQQTSANSANQSIRIQGLDGRYTQILKDGFPLFGGFSSGLSIMQIPPLDLNQVEVIKGSASTLYGGGAIAGLVNLVTKKPIEDEPELSLMLNQTSAMGTTVNGFYAQKFNKTGFSLYVSGNRQDPYDPNKDNFSDIPYVRSITLNPKFFLYPNDSTTLSFGINSALEDRIGGDMLVIEGNPDSLHSFTEQNLSRRYSTQLSFDKKLKNTAQLSLRNSISYFGREINIPNYSFQGNQVASFSEAIYAFEMVKTFWIFGANLVTENFRENLPANPFIRDYQNITLGGFTQNTLEINSKLAMESGLRTDYNPKYGTFVLPRFSLLFKPGKKLSGRLGGGLGYKLPTIFTEEAEALTFQNVLPLDRNSEPERSLGSNFDINYKTIIANKVTFSINQLFFYTQLSNALVLSQNIPSGTWFIENADGTVDSRGFETNIKFTFGDFKLFLQYAYIDAKLNYANINNQKPLTPKHNAGAVLMFEQHGKWRVGFETYYTGQQFLSDYNKTRDYWIIGLMALRELKHFSLFLNFENFIDTRQSRYQEIVQPPINNPTFAEIWAPTDGFVVNGGFIWKLFRKE